MNLHILSNKNMNHETQRKVSSSLITKRFLGQFQQRRKLQICWGQPPSNTHRKPWQTTMAILETDRTWNTVIFVSVSYKGRKREIFFCRNPKSGRHVGNRKWCAWDWSRICACSNEISEVMECKESSEKQKLPNCNFGKWA